MEKPREGKTEQWRGGRREGRGGRTERTRAKGKKGTAVCRWEENWVLALVWEQSSVALNKSLPFYDLKFLYPPQNERVRLDEL